jgi:hypothetical protein
MMERGVEATRLQVPKGSETPPKVERLLSVREPLDAP